MNALLFFLAIDACMKRHAPFHATAPVGSDSTIVRASEMKYSVGIRIADSFLRIPTNRLQTQGTKKMQFLTDRKLKALSHDDDSTPGADWVNKTVDRS
jgi:hypothetical protein